MSMHFDDLRQEDFLVPSLQDRRLRLQTLALLDSVILELDPANDFYRILFPGSYEITSQDVSYWTQNISVGSEGRPILRFRKVEAD